MSPAPSLESLNSIVSENSVGDFLTQVKEGEILLDDEKRHFNLELMVEKLNFSQSSNILDAEVIKTNIFAAQVKRKLIFTKVKRKMK